MNSKTAWAVPDPDRPPEQFWIDFGNFVMATMNYDDSDDYWKTLIKWSDILGKRYNSDPIACHMIYEYIKSQELLLKLDERFPEYKRTEIA